MHLYLPIGGNVFSPSITELHVFFKRQNSIKTHASCKEILQEKFRESICRAFETLSSKPRGQESLGDAPCPGEGWLDEGEKRDFLENPGWREAGKGWLDEVRKRRFSVQPPQRESLGCVGSTGVVFQSLWHSRIPL